MDINCRSVDDDFMESVENYFGDIDDINYFFMEIFKNVDVNDILELNYSN